MTPIDVDASHELAERWLLGVVSFETEEGKRCWEKRSAKMIQV